MDGNEGARRPGEGWDGIEDPHGAAIDAFAREHPAAAWAWSTTPARQEVVRRWVLENHPEVIPAPARRGERARRTS